MPHFQANDVVVGFQDDTPLFMQTVSMTAIVRNRQLASYKLNTGSKNIFCFILMK